MYEKNIRIKEKKMGRFSFTLIKRHCVRFLSTTADIRTREWHN